MGNRTSRVATQGQKVVSQHSQQLREQIEKQVIEDIKAEHVTKKVGARMSQFEIKTRSGIKEQVLIILIIVHLTVSLSLITLLWLKHSLIIGSTRHSEE